MRSRVRIAGMRISKRRACSVLLTFLALGLLAGCAPRPRVATRMLAADADSVVAALAAVPMPAGLSGAGRVRIAFGKEKSPTLSLRFAAGRDRVARAMLRPGVLAPVASFRADSSGWELLVPRERAVFEAGRDSTVPTDLPARLLWLALAPADLARSLERPALTVRNGSWSIRGRLPTFGAGIGGAEISFDPEKGGVTRIGITSERGADIARFAYDEPIVLARRGTSFTIVIPALDTQVQVDLGDVTAGAVATTPPSPLPEGWRRLPADDLRRYLESLAASAGSAARQAYR